MATVSVLISFFCVISYKVVESSSEVLQNNIESQTSGIQDKITCGLCRIGASVLISLIKIGLPLVFFQFLVVVICTIVGYSLQFCSGLATLNLPMVLYTAKNTPNLLSHTICEGLLQTDACNSGRFNWRVNLPPRRTLTSTFTSSVSPNQTFKVLLLTDVHVDLAYTVNGTSKCKESICCQKNQKFKKKSKESCHYWGTYENTDIPWHTYEATVKEAKAKKFDYVYFTGDILNHRIWDSTAAKHVDLISKVYSHLRESFEVPIFPVLGNHEVHPVNLWTPNSVKVPEFSISWLFEVSAKYFSLLIGENVTETVLDRGYYTVSPRPGFRIITINNNMCVNFNLWLYHKPDDPKKYFDWLVKALEKAEIQNEKVHILLHCPLASSDILKICGREYNRIIERFSETVVGQFAGHTHFDEWQVFYSQSKPIGVIFNGASVTTHIGNNPSFKILEIDSQDFSVIDYEEWTFDLAAANLKPFQPLEWYKLYTFRQEFGAKNLGFKEIDKILYKMVDNRTLIQQYHKFKTKNSDVSASCNQKCEQDILCEVSTAIVGFSAKCSELVSLYKRKYHI